MRVGIDRGFDGGMIAWALDLPGCVATGASEVEASNRLPDRAEAFAAWIAAGTGARPPGADGNVDVVEVVDTYRLDDGYEVNAIFDADRQPVAPGEAEGVLSWLELAHERLRSAVARAEGPLSGAGRSRDELVVHVVRAERWLATRTERDRASITFPRDDLPSERQLDDNGPFVRRHVLRAAGGDGVNERVDSRGEHWTARKMLRRLVYHVLDHAEEMERRGGSGPLPRRPTSQCPIRH